MTSQIRQCLVVVALVIGAIGLSVPTQAAAPGQPLAQQTARHLDTAVNGGWFKALIFTSRQEFKLFRMRQASAPQWRLDIVAGKARAHIRKIATHIELKLDRMEADAVRKLQSVPGNESNVLTVIDAGEQVRNNLRTLLQQAITRIDNQAGSTG